MAYEGQPVPSTEYQIPQPKVSDGQSVVVTAPGKVVAGEFYEIEGVPRSSDDKCRKWRHGSIEYRTGRVSDNEGSTK